MKVFLVCVALGAVVGCTVQTQTAEKGEFVCYVSGAVKEIHYGVTQAAPVAGGYWQLTYAEGNKAWYMQRPGEACGLET